MRTNLQIGLDDTDSPRGGCTTYVAALIVKMLAGKGADFTDYPNLVRLNPNVPWKTRGNGALCLRVRCDESWLEEIKEETLLILEGESDTAYPETDPAVVFHTGVGISPQLTSFSKRAVKGIVGLGEAVRILRSEGMEAVGFKDGRGIIGALAAIGERLLGDHTYEFLAYRTPENRGHPRCVDEASVFEMDRVMRGATFDNVDREESRVLITPAGPDPVLFGIRGESAEAVAEAATRVRVEEEVERWVIFRSNQGTDAHLHRTPSISEVEAHQPVIVEGRVSRSPFTIEGGHVIFELEDETGSVDCAAYEPTGGFRRIVRRLVIGDLLEVHGGVRPPSEETPLTINLEKMRVLDLEVAVRSQNPFCHRCGRRMESMGSGGGYRCDRCGLRDRNASKLYDVIAREFEEKLYIPPPRAHRHLTKPHERYGREKRGVERGAPGAFWGEGIWR